MSAMDIVPVLDLLGGEVVHARGGARASYRPIVTPLAKGSDAVAVAEGLLRLAPFARLYVADLDAIEGRPGNVVALRRLRAAFPDLAIWIDAGVKTAAQVQAMLDAGAGEPVIGSESQADLSVLEIFAREPRIALSLDFRGEDFLGPQALLERVDLWPRKIIAMTLARVGAGLGPDFSRLATLIAAGAREVYAAGGVRDATDLETLAAAGARGALVASALHDGRLGPAALAQAMRPKMPHGDDQAP